MEATFILDEECYIVMPYEDGGLLNLYWAKTDALQQVDVATQMKDCVNSLCVIKSDFIGGVDRFLVKTLSFYSIGMNPTMPMDQAILGRALTVASYTRYATNFHRT